MQAGLPAQEGLPSQAGPNPQTNAVVVPTGESVVLELQDPLNTRQTRKGDHATFKTSTEVLAGGQVAIPRGSLVRATVKESKRARPLGHAQIQLDFNEVELPDGTSLPLAAELSRAGWWQSNGKIQQTVKGEHGRGRAAATIGQRAAMGAILGGVFGGRGGLARGAAVGGAIGAVGVLLQRGPDLDLPPGMMFEIELVKPLAVPLPRRASPGQTEQAETRSPELAPTIRRGGSSPDLPALAPYGAGPATAGPTVQPPASTAPAPPAAASAPASPERPAADSPAVAANRTPPPPMPPAPATVPVPASRDAPGGFTLKMDVNLVLVEATVRDARGALVDNLKREDFRLFEDGVEQQVRYFSRDELPLAVALVVDRSGSMAPVLRELREAAYQTLSLLKPEDEVALFAFASRPERLEYLTPDRRRIAERIADITAGGGTNITDALFEAALYLGRAAPGRRHAIILISDNQGTVRGYAGDGEVVRMALETEAVIYSIKIGSPGAMGVFNFPMSIAGTGSVKKVTHETGGEIIDADRAGSVGGAMAAVISRLKQRYTLGYQSTNHRRDGTFRALDVHLETPGLPATAGQNYSVYARRGYYGPGGQSASRNK